MKRMFITIMFIACLFCFCGCDNNINYDGEYIVNIVDSEVIEGKEAMDDFYQRTMNGEELTIIINRSYTNSQSNYSNYISYDGEYYITDLQLLEGNVGESKFKYLNYSQTNGNNNHIVKTEAYCLSNDEYTTYEKILRSWLSAVLENHIYDSIPIYSINYYIDLCFNKSKVNSITYNSRYYAVNSFNENIAIEMVDCLSWVNKPLDNYGNNNWTLKLDMTRTILNDANGLLLGKKNDQIDVEYIFDFEKKIVVMHYPTISSLSHQLYAKLTNESIEKLNDLFRIFQGYSDTNWGEYSNDILLFEINEDNSGIIRVIGKDIVEKIDVINVNGDGTLMLQTNDGLNYYVFTFRGNQNKGGYTYISAKSKPTTTMNKYFENNMFFKWMGYPYN